MRTISLSMLLVAALLFVAVEATPEALPDVQREKRHAEQVIASLVVGDAVWLTTATGGRFLGLFVDVPRPKGAVILTHGPGWHPDYGLTGELRLALADRGYVTLSLQMPVLAADEEDGAKYRELYPQASERIAAGVRLLQEKGFARVAIVSHAMGSGMTYHWLKRSPQAPLFAWVALSFYGSFDDMPKLAFPVLDMFGADDYRGIRWPASGRKRMLDRVDGSKQIEVADGGWFLAGGTAAVLREVAAFLDAKAPR
ncbi:MAG: DUF3530 family protein [Betaproteobacteria bacterium]|nr:DUF3530 family protein [Betaproteobacteria bacterium]